jgi:hypothetical protein
MTGSTGGSMNEHDIDLAVRIPGIGRWPDDVALWCVDMRDAAGREDTIFRNLDVAERVRADRYVLREDSRRFIATRATLRKLLGSRIGVSPTELVFVATEQGRLELPDDEAEPESGCGAALKNSYLSRSRRYSRSIS